MEIMAAENKTTIELENEIKEATDIEDYLQTNQKYLTQDGFCEYLNTLLSSKGIRKADVVRESLLDRAYVYQIFSGERTPSRDKLIALAFGMHLTDAETQKMLKLSCNRELYAKDERDVLILFALQHKQTIMDVNESLFRHGFPALGAPPE
ncbi:MAG: helix-turn-helix domain-containing protein [Bacteroidales bacterium]|nr:helix-turn-helix domain-containing protein [Lachnoclostridium sp.]MCM1385607.1 helix-turn-helix domain-containing protein [Lachnoclostridium sp.]MCM1466322.1 helix-turn-helix domain-containing protein [Bacteroidales bacterium]